MNFLQSILSEEGTANSGSTMRVCALLVVVVMVGTWATVSIQQKVLQPISVEQMGLVLGAMGIKAWQRGKENPEPTKA
jgi:hypothetical protein